MKIHRSGQQKMTSARGPMARRLALGCSVSVASVACGMAAGTANAQTAAAPAGAASAPTAADEAEQVGKIVVTARRRDEALVDVPLAISVVTSAKLQQLGITSTTELANYVPGLEFNNFTPGNARNDRGSGRIIAFRGLLVSTVGGGGASMFLNGAAVVGNELPVGLDIGSVEVLRGPQSVYFGRSTMTGAVSYQTKKIPDQLVGQGVAEIGQRNLRNISASVASPLIDGLLGARLTVLSESSDGYVTNSYNNGATKLGDTSRKSVSGTVELTPTSALSIKGYFNRFRDDDGPSATAFIPASLDNCKLGTTQTTFCGEIPGRQFSYNYINTTIPANMSDLIFSSPLLRGVGFDKKVGQQRLADNSDIAATWNISDYLRLQAITGYHLNTTSAALDGIGQPVQPSFRYSGYFYTFTQRFRDFSQELRLSSDPEERLSWTFGTNYIANTIFTHAIVGFQNQPSGTFTPANQALGEQINKTKGVFGGAYFKLTPQWTLSAEAREQSDRRRAKSTNQVSGALLSDLSETFKSFSPRVAADYDLGGRKKVYASYATGTRPGGFNTTIAAQAGNPAALAQIAELLGGGGTTYKEEKLKIAELGFKGELAGGKGYFDINAYKGTLVNQQITIGALIPILGFSVTGTANAGESAIHGIEFQGNYNFTREFSLAATAAWNHTNRTKFLNTSGIPQFGTTDFSGKEFAFVPEYSGSLVASYSTGLSNGWGLFSTVAETYRGKMFADTFNASYIKARFQTDVRAGVSKSDLYTVELYVKNLLNDQNYTGGGVSPDFGTSSFNAFFGGWAPPRQVGMRFSAKF